MKRKFVFAHMRAARLYGDMSTCIRRKVGAMIVMGNTPISIGYNGTEPGASNRCESEDGSMTLPTVIHAEDNALRKLALHGMELHMVSFGGASLFVTDSPCEHCFAKCVQAGIRTYFFSKSYRIMQHLHDYLDGPTEPRKGYLFYRVNTEEETIHNLYLDRNGEIQEARIDYPEILIL